MLQRNPVLSGQEDLFRSRLDSIIDMRHELVKLAQIVDWEGLFESLSEYYCCDNGRPGEPIRLMVGLLLLKDTKGLSDEEVCTVWRENPYFQYFCGEEFFAHRLPVEPPSLSIFRKRIGEAGMARLLAETIRVGLVTGTLKAKDVESVNIDTTVQEKAIKFPTDTGLCHKAREELLDFFRNSTALANLLVAALLKSACTLKYTCVFAMLASRTLLTAASSERSLLKTAGRHAVSVRQSYVRKSKEALFLANKYFGARQMGRGRKEAKKIRNYLGRVMRDICRAIEKDSPLAAVFKDDLAKARIIYAQAGDPKSPEKIYSWHAPEVECIAKGKAHKKYEFGCKASLASTSRSNFIVAAQAHHGKPYDGHTPGSVLTQIKALTGISPREAYVDLGYRGHGLVDSETEVILSRQKRGITPARKKRQKRRNALEPIIGHCKNDRKIGPRNWLQGIIGDQINAIAMAIGFNIRKILKKIFLFLLDVWIITHKNQYYQMKLP